MDKRLNFLHYFGIHKKRKEMSEYKVESSLIILYGMIYHFVFI